MKRLKLSAILLILLFCICTVMTACNNDDSKTDKIKDSVISITLKYNDSEITDDLITVDMFNAPLTFTADVQVTGKASKDFTLDSSNTAVATVTEKTVTIIAAGETTITAIAVDDTTKQHAITLTVLGDETPIPNLNAPYFITNNLGEDSSSEFYVQWHNDSTVATQKLQIVTETGDFANATTMTVTGVSFRATGDVGTFAARNIFRARVTGLTPNTRYKYRMGDRGVWSDTFYYLTSSGTAADFSFTVVSDPQSSTHAAMTATLTAADTFDADNRFYLMGGDLVDQIGAKPSEIVSYTNAANGFNINRPIAATQGNHDTQYIDNGYRFGAAEVFNAFITFPDNGGDTQVDKANRSQSYYFYYNRVLIIMLNTMATSVGTIITDPDYTRQMDWLKDVLENDRTNNLSRYTIVCTHIGPFGGRDNTRWPTAISRQAFTKIFTDYNVDIVFSGHDHVYGRSDPIKITVEMSGKNDNTDYLAMEAAGNFDPVTNGTVFSVVSATGPKFYQISISDQWVPKFYPVRADNPKDDDPGVFINVKVTAEKLIVTAQKIDGTTLDTYEVAAK